MLTASFGPAPPPSPASPWQPAHELWNSVAPRAGSPSVTGPVDAFTLGLAGCVFASAYTVPETATNSTAGIRRSRTQARPLDTRRS